MEPAELIADVLKYIVPAGLVLLAVKFVLDQRMKQERLKEGQLLHKEVIRNHLPILLTAYERGILFLERIKPENLILRVGANGKSGKQLHMDILQEIRGEFEHNLAQQTYISTAGWQALVEAKESLLAMINEIARNMPSEADGLTFGKKIIQQYNQDQKVSIQRAIFLLKSDIVRLFKIS